MDGLGRCPYCKEECLVSDDLLLSEVICCNIDCTYSTGWTVREVAINLHNAMSQLRVIGDETVRYVDTIGSGSKAEISKAAYGLTEAVEAYELLAKKAGWL